MIQPFRTNWWKHFCKPQKMNIWIHMSYRSCGVCKLVNPNIKIEKGSKPM